ncbi:MAG: lipid-A-disaccharide synthase [Candidatus Omnitrophica bacterium]|nr:lipid-A-disaccharide synthase [Candidatus Omnitrophota bacterium]
MAQKRILIICGEPSGDLHAACLVKKILELDPEIKISAVGGEYLRQTQTEIYVDIKDLSCLGFFDVLRKIPKFLALEKLLFKKIKTQKLQAVICVDFSGFNLRFAKKLNRSLPVIYYISPQVWASRRGRIKTIKKYIDKIIVFFKFEQNFYKEYGIDADFVGHPLLDTVKPTHEKKEFLKELKMSEFKTTIALLPGSRKSEIKNILPIMVKTAILIRKELSATQFIIVKSPQVGAELYQKIIKKLPMEMKIVEGKTYDCLNVADFALVASGTATLETTIMQKPFVIIYKLSLLNYLLYRPQVKVPYIGMINLLANKLIIPEFIQGRACPKRIAQTVLKILKSPQEIAKIKEELSKAKTLLGEPGATFRAAKIILDFLFGSDCVGRRG